MEVTETLSEGLKREFKVTVPASELETAIEGRLSEIAKTVKMKGFRPGKVPLTIVRSRYRDSVLGEILQATVQNSSQRTLVERELRPAGQPSIEISDYGDGKDLEFTMGVELLPEIELGDFSDLALTKLRAEVTDAEVDEALKRVADGQKVFETVSEARQSKAGDALLIDFQGSVDGQARDDMAATDFELELGGGAFVPGFEDQLTGAKAGDHRQVKVTFPKEYPSSDVAGKEAVFEVEVKEVRKRAEVGVDDALASRQGFDDLAALREAVRRQMQQDYEGASKARLKRELLDELAGRYSFDVPAGMVEQEFETIWAQIQADVEREKSTFEDVLGQAEEEAKTEYRDIAVRRVRLGLLLSEVGRQNNITTEQDDLLNAALESARNLPNPQQVLDFYRGNPGALERFRAPVFEDKVVAFLTEMATITDKAVKPEDLFRDPDEDSPGDKDKAAAKPAAGAKKKAPAKAKSTKGAAAKGGKTAAKSGGQTGKGNKTTKSAQSKSSKTKAKD